MLKLVIPATELFDEESQTFSNTKETVLSVEHSLLSLSKWESKWCVPFLSKEEKSARQTLDYIKCMTLTQNVDDVVYEALTTEHIDAIRQYIDAPMTATTITDRSGGSREIITAEIIYYWMIALNIPFECQKWHLNRLLMLINVCSIKQEDPKKMSRREVINNQRELNAKRRAELGTSG